MSFLTGARIKIGFFLREIWRENLLDVHVYYNHYKHLTEIYANMIRPLGLLCDDFTLYRPPDLPQKKEQLGRLLKNRVNFVDDKIVCINVNASPLCPERKWPKDKFVKLIRRLLDNFDIKIVLIGSPSEAEYVSQVYSEIDSNYGNKLINLAGKIDICMLIELFKSSGLLITNDSGPLHFAVMVGLDTISFFGPETPLLYGPVGAEHTVFFKDLYCSPCLNVYNVKTALCGGDNKCMQAISVDEVFDKVGERLG